MALWIILFPKYTTMVLINRGDVQVYRDILSEKKLSGTMANSHNGCLMQARANEQGARSLAMLGIARHRSSVQLVM